MILKWFESTEATSFAQRLTAEILAGLDHESPRKAQSAKRVQAKAGKLVDAVLTKADAFKRQQHPNLYQKAKILNTVKWGLREAGVDDSIIAQFISAMAPRL